jgi:hypothetical protein
MRQAFPGSEYYDGSAPPTLFDRRRTYPPLTDLADRDDAEQFMDGSHVHCCSING